MSRSVSAPSSVTKTSPCWNGFIVPGSTLMYGSSFCIVTRRPRHLRRRPSEDAVRPFPKEEATPPVTKMCFVTGLHHTASPLEPGGIPHVACECWMRTWRKAPRSLRSSSPHGREELLRVLPGALAVGRAGQHPRELDHALVVVEDQGLR